MNRRIVNWPVVGVATVAVWCFGISATALGQGLVEDFNSASGQGGADVLIGSGFNTVASWDDALVGEQAFGGTFGDGAVTLIRAEGLTSGGVGDSGAGLLTVSGATFTDGGWYAGLAWPDLTLPFLDPTLLSLTADVYGDVSGGAYQLRIEGLRIVPFGFTEDFEGGIGQTPVKFLDSTTPPGVVGFTNNWDDGIANEQAFAGFNGGGSVTPTTGGVSAYVDLTSGVSGSKAGVLAAEGLTPDPGGTWFAGMVWPGYSLGTTDLAAITLTAQIKGEAISGGTLGDYMLRLEDSDSDYRAFKVSSTGSFQSVGGALLGAVDGGIGIGDGVFDPNSGPFSVVIVFDNDSGDTWGPGGVLTVDNLVFDCGTTNELVGSVYFDGTADGASFQTVGGVLSTGVSTLDNVDEHFETVVGPVTDGVFFNSSSGASGYIDNWDDGIVGEEAFVGIYGAVTVTGDARAYGDLSVGDGGTGGGVLEVTGLDVAGPCDYSGWYAGLTWPMQILPDLPLNDITMVARVKGQAVTGGTAGDMMIRLEDADQDYLYYILPANGQFRTLGGSLGAASTGSGHLATSDGVFDPDRAPFTLVIAFENPCTSWGPGGRLTVDNVLLTNAAFGTGIDTWSVALSFIDEVATWGTDGTLVVDNINLGAAPLAPEPVVPAEGPQGSRYLRFKAPAPAAAAATEQVVRVRATALNGFPLPDPDVLYVAAPIDAPDEDSAHPGLTFRTANLSCEPVFHTWTAEPTVAIYGGELVPGSSYEIQRADSSCADLSDESCWSTPVVFETAKFGDAVAPFEGEGSTQPDFADISAVVDKFLATPTAPAKALAQLHPNVPFPMRPIDFMDIADAVSAFLGSEFASIYTGPCVCPSTVTCGTVCSTDAACAPGFCIDGQCTDECGRCSN